MSLKFKFQNHEAGTSMLEMMIGLGLLSMVTVVAGTYFRAADRMQVEMRARQTAIEHVNLAFETIKRDLSKRTYPKDGSMEKLPCGSLCTHIRYSRSAKSKVPGVDGNYRMMFTSYCQDLPPALKLRYEKLGHPLDFSRTNLKKLFGKNPKGGVEPRCMEVLYCPYGKYPQIVRHIEPKLGDVVYNANAILESYPFSILPANVQDISYGSGLLGAAVCSEEAGSNADRVVIDAAVLAEGETFRILQHEVVIPRGNLSKLQIQE